MCTCVLAGSLLHGPGETVVEWRGVKLMFVWEFKSIRTRTYRIGIFRKIFDQLIFSQVMYMCIHRFNVCRLVCPLFSEFSCDFYQAHFHNILICTSHMLKTATRARVRAVAVAPTSSAINQGALVFKITRCDS